MRMLDRSVRANGLTFHYTEWGAPDAPALVLLHGITSHARAWDHLAARLEGRFRVLALDQRGHGDSDAPADDDYRIAPMADDVAAFADALGLGTFSLLGLSMGGRIAIVYTAAHPSRVDRLVIVDMGPEVNPAGLTRVRNTMLNAPERVESEKWAFQYLRRANPLYDDALLRARVHHGLKRLPDGTLTWKFAKGLRDMMREGRRDPIDLWEPLRRIPCPTLLVRGSESDILAPETAKRMLEALPDGRLVEIAGAGHTVPGDRPEEFARAVTSFLGE